MLTTDLSASIAHRRRTLSRHETQRTAFIIVLAPSHQTRSHPLRLSGSRFDLPYLRHSVVALSAEDNCDSQAYPAASVQWILCPTFDHFSCDFEASVRLTDHELAICRIKPHSSSSSGRLRSPARVLYHLNTCLDAAQTVDQHYHRPSTRPATTHCAKSIPPRPAQSSPLSTDNIGAPAPPHPNLSVNSPVPGRGRNPHAAANSRTQFISVPESTERQASFSSLKPRSAQVSPPTGVTETRRKKPYLRIRCYHRVT